MALARGLAALVLLTPLLTAGCVAPRVGAESVTLTFACRDHEVLLYRSLVEAFQHEHPGVVIRLASQDEIASNFPEHPAGEIGRLAGAVDAFAAGPPDGAASLEGVLLDLTPYAQRQGIYPGEELFAGAVAPFLRNGRLYGLPHEAHAYVVYYDPTAFEEAGLPVPQPGWTKNDLLRAAVATTERQGGATSRYGLVDRWPGYTIAALAGGGTDGGDAPSPALDAVALGDALLWYADLVRVHHAAPDPTAVEAEDTEALLMGERPPAMWTGHSFEAGRFRRRYGADVAPLPAGRQLSMPITVEGYVVSAQTAHPEVAWRWIEFLSRQPSATYYGGIIVRRSAAYWSELDDGTAASFRYCLENGTSYGPDVWTPVQVALLDLLQGESLGAVMERGPWEVPAAPQEATASRPSAAGGAAHLPRAMAEERLPETGAAAAAAIRFGVRSGQDQAPYRRLADRFSLEQNDITVEIVEGDAAADCFVAGAEVAGNGQEGGLVPLGRFMAEAHLLRAYPRPLIAPLRMGGQVWGLPLDADARVLVYHRAPFDAAGLSYPSVSWAAQDVVEYAALLTEAAADPPRYGYWPRGGAARGAGEMIAWLGGTLLGADGRPTLDAPTAVAAMGRYAELIASSPSDAVEGASDGSVPWGSYPALVEGGRVAMWLDDYASARLAANRNPELGIAPLPAGAVMPTPRLERALYISSGATDPEACWQWLWYLGGRPEAAELFPARLEVASRDDWRGRVGNEAVGVWQATLRRLQVEGDTWGPYSDGTTLRWVDRAFEEVRQGADPAEALGRAQAVAEAYAACMAPEGAEVRHAEECARVAEGGEVADAAER